MFYDPLENETFAPKINRASKSLASTLAPLAERQQVEMVRKQQRLAEIADAVAQAKRNDETFAPQINRHPPPGLQLSERVPLAERVNHRHPEEAPDDPNATHKPAINPASAALCTDTTRAQLAEAREVRRRVREVWAQHTDGSSMSAGGVAKALVALGLPDDRITQLKFAAALGLDPGKPEQRYVEYERFSKVFTSVLSKALHSRQHGATSAAPPAAAEASTTPMPRRKAASTAHAACQDSVSAPPPRPAASARQAPRQAPKRKEEPCREGAAPVAAESRLHRQRLERDAALAHARRELAVQPFVPREERELQQCTFAPRILTHPARSASAAPSTRDATDANTTAAASRGGDRSCSRSGSEASSQQLPRALTNAPGFDSAVRRMEQARRKATPRFEESLRKAPGAAAIGHTAAASPATGAVASTVPTPFRSHLEQRHRAKPMLYVDVDMPNGKHGRIGIYRGDDPEHLARNFCTAYHLDARLEERLTELLRGKMQLAESGSLSDPQWR